MPVLTARTSKSSSTARHWASTMSDSVVATEKTPSVFWAVKAVIAVVPCTPKAAKVRRSAWIPAPPPESEPAMLRTVSFAVALAPTREAATVRR